MSIGMVYESPSTDELGIRLTAEELDIDLIDIPFRKIAIHIDDSGFNVKNKRKDYSADLSDIQVILNRAQSKNRRLVAASVFENLGKYLINPYDIENQCASKLRTILSLHKAGVKIPATTFVPCDSEEKKADGNPIDNSEDIAELLHQSLGTWNQVLKPDQGSHGRGVVLVNSYDDLIATLRKRVTSIINPIGVFSQQLVQKWFFDLRIIIAKEKGRNAYCLPQSLARTNFSDFRTNTYLGNMSFGVTIPTPFKKLAVKCGEAIGGKNGAWVLALDAMVNFNKDLSVDKETVKPKLDALAPFFKTIIKLRTGKITRLNFKKWNLQMEKAFTDYTSSEHYTSITNLIEESLQGKENALMFHEVNSCPDFWEWTRLVAGINIAILLLKSAQSIME